MPTTTASDTHVEALWWLATKRGVGVSYFSPGDAVINGVPCKYKIVIADSQKSETLTIESESREAVLDRVVGLMVEEKLDGN